MKRHTAFSALAIVGLAALPVLAIAQENRPAAGSSAAGTGVAASGGGHANGGGSSSGGGSTSGGSSSGGGSSTSGGSSGGGGFSGAGSTGGRVDVGGRHATTGGSGVAVSRGDRGRDSDGATGAAGPRSGTDAGSRGKDAGGASGPAAVGREGREPRTLDGTRDGSTAGSPVHARPRDGNEPIVGTAVPRGSVPPAGGGGVIVGGAPFYPWWFGGAGYYGGYYGGYYDPWYGAYPSSYQGGSSDEGALRLKIKPREAEVYVDGYYVGVVDDFDGIFQKLHIDSGAHRIEVRAPGYEPLTFDVRITPDHSTTYQGEMKKLP
jgi:PEGA domain